MKIGDKVSVEVGSQQFKDTDDEIEELNKIVTYATRCKKHLEKVKA
ncbi:hypothetical protein L1G62_001952 [Staphylococcus pseudintermedius]|nr:hypothetical protein [Staphylococcus pseudintermedius]